jgi:hypothetical protein
MEIPKPSHSIGDKVFRIEDGKIVERTITGVVQLFRDVDRFNDPKELVRAVYFMDRKPDVKTWDWVAEKDLFTSREQLIASLG